MKKLFLLELNELNFDIARLYVERGANLPGFKKLFDDFVCRRTTSESDYSSLEPWIQWPSVHTGKRYSEHKIYRLGDVVFYEGSQLFETLERYGFRVGCVSPMNADNRLLTPAYFIPDPWTETNSDNSFLSRLLTSALRQAVNDNSNSKLTLKTLITFVVCSAVLVSPSSYLRLVTSAFRSVSRPWRRALFLDELLWEFHSRWFNTKNPNFSVLFLNAGAHIQHHYLLNSKYVSKATPNPSWYVEGREDPFFEMLTRYDFFLKNLPVGADIVIATGLTQTPYGAPTYYYRLKNHSEFLRVLGIRFLKVSPRMTRDFLIVFEHEADAQSAAALLGECLIDGIEKCFGEIDNRGREIFVTLTYPLEITPGTELHVQERRVPLFEYVSFVAIKNGEHCGDGYCFFGGRMANFAFSDGEHVSGIYRCVLDYFNE